MEWDPFCLGAVETHPYLSRSLNSSLNFLQYLEEVELSVEKLAETFSGQVANYEESSHLEFARAQLLIDMLSEDCGKQSASDNLHHRFKGPLSFCYEQRAEFR